MRSFPRLALSTVPVDVTFSPLSNSATRSRSSNRHSIVWALRDIPFWSDHGPVLMDPGAWPVAWPSPPCVPCGT